MLMSSSQFTKQSGGLPTGQVKLPKGSSLPKGSGLGGDSKVRSYPKWIQKEINSVSYVPTGVKVEIEARGGRGGGGSSENKDDESSDGEEDEKTEKTVPPKSEREAEKEHTRRHIRKLNNNIARDEGFPEEDDSDNSDVDVLSPESSRLKTEFKNILNVQTPQTPRTNIRQLLRNTTPTPNPLFQTPQNILSALASPFGSVTGRPSSTFLPNARTRGVLRQPTPDQEADFGSPLFLMEELV